MSTILNEESIKSAHALEELLNETHFGKRRDFLKKGTLAALAATLPIAAWLNQTKSARAGNRGTATDVDILTTAYNIEIQAVNTYTAAAGLTDGSGNPYVSGAYLSVALAFAGDHQAHAARFKDVIAELGGPAPSDPTDALLDDFPPGPNTQLDSTVGILRYALGLEVVAAKLWFSNFKDVTDLKAKRAFADIAPNEAAHAAIFRAALKLIAGVSTDHDSGDPGKAIVPYSALSLDSAVF